MPVIQTAFNNRVLGALAEIFQGVGETCTSPVIRPEVAREQADGLQGRPAGTRVSSAGF
jgi:hypothetical protein